MFGKDQPVILQLLEIPVEAVQKALEGVAMELDDCAFPLLRGMVLTDDPNVAFRTPTGRSWSAAKPRGPGMERERPARRTTARSSSARARPSTTIAANDVRVVVVGNPCNTNCLIAASTRPTRLGPSASRR